MTRIYHVLALILLSGCPLKQDEPLPATAAEESPSCPEDMVLIPGGDYLLGRSVAVLSWRPPSEARAPDGYWALPNPAAPVSVRPFCLDMFEFPNRRGAVPRTFVSWNEARRLCAERGKRLPSRVEWQAAAQGKKGHRYSYGATFEKGRCNTSATTGDFDAIQPSGSLPDCRNPLGVYDLNGNVSEWVEDDWAGPWDANDVWGGPDSSPKTIMGGTAWPGDLYGQDSTSRHRHPPGDKWKDDGLRCAKNTVPSQHKNL